MSIFKTRVKIYNVFIKRLSHATGSLLGSWSMTVLHVKGKFETEPPHCALGWLPQHSPPQHSPPPALTAKVPNPGGLKGKISPSVKLPQSLHFQWLNPSENGQHSSSRPCNLTTGCTITAEGPLYSLHHIRFVFRLGCFLRGLFLLLSWFVSFFKTRCAPHISPLCSLESNPSLRMPKIKLYMSSERRHPPKGKRWAP